MMYSKSDYGSGTGLSYTYSCSNIKNNSFFNSLINNDHVKRTLSAFRHGSLKNIIPFQDIWIFENGTLKVDNVKLIEGINYKNHNQQLLIVGTLYLTATHLIFVDAEGQKETWILHMHISSLSKLPLNTSGCPLVIRCKTFQVVSFIIPKERDCHDVFTSLLKLSKPSEYLQLFAFHYTPAHQHIGNNINFNKTIGWDMFDLRTEYSRMGLPNKYWFEYDQTDNYQLCDTYPRYLYMPLSAKHSKSLIKGSSKFRSRNRLPVLSYLYTACRKYQNDNLNSNNDAFDIVTTNDNGNIDSVCFDSCGDDENNDKKKNFLLPSICRSAQPLSGLTARCNEDEDYLQAIIGANPNSGNMYILDNRPKINAMANRAKGKGYENENNYQNVKFHFANIENIHVMRNSLNTLREGCEKKHISTSSWLKCLKESSWLKHIKDVLDSAIFVSEAIQSGNSVLIHCSDGWDRTSQTSSLAQILLDPYYRTIKGFQMLIFKEWLSFGYKFSDRCGHLDGVDVNEISPIFSQFLDCVWQIMVQFPYAFQFNERLLFEIHDHIYSCQFGTFLGNCEKDRLDLRLRERTYSFWIEIDSKFDDFINPFYDLDEYDISRGMITSSSCSSNSSRITDACGGQLENMILKPDTSAQLIKFWRSMYQRWDDGMQPRENISDTVTALKEHIKSLSEHKKLLENRISSLCKVLNKEEDNVKESTLMLSSSESMDTNTLKLLDDTNSICNTNNSNNQEESSTLTSLDDVESGFDECYSNSLECLQVANLINELKSVAIDWKSFRNVGNCKCASPFLYSSKKNHCWRCGLIFCNRCINNKKHVLPGHATQNPVPVCKLCSKQLKRSKSFTECCDSSF